MFAIFCVSHVSTALVDELRSKISYLLLYLVKSAAT